MKWIILKSYIDFSDGEDDSKPLKTDPIKSEESIKKAPNDDEAMDETQDEGLCVLFYI